jgi:Methyltransferase domain
MRTGARLAQCSGWQSAAVPAYTPSPKVRYSEALTAMKLPRALRAVAYPPSGLTACWSDLPGDGVPLPDAITAILPDDSTSYPISRALGHLLACLVLRGGVRNVLELGAGWSSLVLARSLASVGGGRLTSVESCPEWCAEQWEAVKQTPGVDAHMEVAAPKFQIHRSGPFFVFATARPALEARGPFDLLFVDAPQCHYGRDGALPLVLGLLTPGALIVLDDGGRPQEQWAVRRWLQTYLWLSLVGYRPTFGRHGIVVLKVEGTASGSSGAWRAWVSGSVHAAVNSVARRVLSPPVS